MNPAPRTSPSDRALGEQFDDLPQQTEAARLGMWLFLATEVLLFGGLFAAYMVYRFAYPQAFAAASRTLSLGFGTVDTVVLLTSSFTMVLAIHAAQTGRRGRCVGLLLATAGLGVAFLGLHGTEYFHDYAEGHFPGPGFRFPGAVASSNHVQIFFLLYFIMTGLHSLHVLIGVSLLAFMAWRAHRGAFSPEYHTPLELSGLYWHFVDLVWVFLFPLLYLVARH